MTVDLLERLRACESRAGRQLDDLVRSDRAQRPVPADRRHDPGGAGAGAKPSGTGPGRPGRRPPPAGARGLAVLAVAVTISVAVAGYALVSRPSSKPQNVACFAAADLRADTAVVGVDDAGPGGDVRRPVGQGLPRAPLPAPVRACVLESGVVGVFPEAPGRDVCLDLGLAASRVGAPTHRVRR